MPSWARMKSPFILKKEKMPAYLDNFGLMGTVLVFPLVYRCPFVPGQGQEQKSRDKLLCPGMSWDKITFPPPKKTQKKPI